MKDTALSVSSALQVNCMEQPNSAHLIQDGEYIAVHNKSPTTAHIHTEAGIEGGSAATQIWQLPPPPPGKSDSLRQQSVPAISAQQVLQADILQTGGMEHATQKLNTAPAVQDPLGSTHSQSYKQGGPDDLSSNKPTLFTRLGDFLRKPLAATIFSGTRVSSSHPHSSSAGYPTAAMPSVDQRTPPAHIPINPNGHTLGQSIPKGLKMPSPMVDAFLPKPKPHPHSNLQVPSSYGNDVSPILMKGPDTGEQPQLAGNVPRKRQRNAGRQTHGDASASLKSTTDQDIGQTAHEFDTQWTAAPAELPESAPQTWDGSPGQHTPQHGISEYNDQSMPPVSVCQNLQPAADGVNTDQDNHTLHLIMEGHIARGAGSTIQEPWHSKADISQHMDAPVNDVHDNTNGNLEPVVPQLAGSSVYSPTTVATMPAAAATTAPAAVAAATSPDANTAGWSAGFVSAGGASPSQDVVAAPTHTLAGLVHQPITHTEVNEPNAEMLQDAHVASDPQLFTDIDAASEEQQPAIKANLSTEDINMPPEQQHASSPLAASAHHMPAPEQSNTLQADVMPAAAVCAVCTEPGDGKLYTAVNQRKGINCTNCQAADNTVMAVQAFAKMTAVSPASSNVSPGAPASPKVSPAQAAPGVKQEPRVDSSMPCDAVSAGEHDVIDLSADSPVCSAAAAAQPSAITISNEESIRCHAGVPMFECAQGVVCKPPKPHHDSDGAASTPSSTTGGAAHAAGGGKRFPGTSDAGCDMQVHDTSNAPTAALEFQDDDLCKPGMHHTPGTLSDPDVPAHTGDDQDGSSLVLHAAVMHSVNHELSPLPVDVRATATTANPGASDQGHCGSVSAAVQQHSVPDISKKVQMMRATATAALQQPNAELDSANMAVIDFGHVEQQCDPVLQTPVKPSLQTAVAPAVNSMPTFTADMGQLGVSLKGYHVGDDAILAATKIHSAGIYDMGTDHSPLHRTGEHPMASAADKNGCPTSAVQHDPKGDRSKQLGSRDIYAGEPGQLDMTMGLPYQCQPEMHPQVADKAVPVQYVLQFTDCQQAAEPPGMSHPECSQPACPSQAETGALHTVMDLPRMITPIDSSYRGEMCEQEGSALQQPVTNLLTAVADARLSPCTVKDPEAAPPAVVLQDTLPVSVQPLHGMCAQQQTVSTSMRWLVSHSPSADKPAETVPELHAPVSGVIDSNIERVDSTCRQAVSDGLHTSSNGYRAASQQDGPQHRSRGNDKHIVMHGEHVAAVLGKRARQALLDDIRGWSAPEAVAKRQRLLQLPTSHRPLNIDHLAGTMTSVDMTNHKELPGMKYVYEFLGISAVVTASGLAEMTADR
eukprot:jgi/Chrzof1/1138/Cz01g42010.t1